MGKKPNDPLVACIIITPLILMIGFMAIKKYIQQKKRVKVSISLNEKTTVKFGDNFEFSVEKLDQKMSYYYHYFQIKDVKGNFKITKITENDDDFEKRVPYMKYNNTFHLSETSTLDLNFYWSHIKADKTSKPVIPVKECQKKKAEDFVKKVSVSPDDKTMVKFGEDFQFSIEKTDQKENSIYNYFQIKDIKGTFKITKITENYENEDASLQTALTNDQLPVIATPSTTNESSVWYRIGTNDRFADVFFVTSDGTKIPSHRCILAEFSPIFAKIFTEMLETPVEINVEDIEADTVKAGLQSLYGKNDAINGKEMNVFKFAAKYDIHQLIEACCTRLEKCVDPSNVCEYIQIAYENNVGSLKEKCLKILCENRKEVSALNLARLPHNILVDALSF